VLTVVCLASVEVAPVRAVAPSAFGPLPAPVANAFDEGLFQVPPPRPVLTTSSAQTVWNVPIVLFSFTDQPLAYSAADFNFGLFDTTGSTTTGSVYDYYQSVSGHRIRVIGRVVATVALSHEKNYYAYNSWGMNSSSAPHNVSGAVDEALQLADPFVDWSEFDRDKEGYVDMVWFVHSGLGGEATVTPDNLWSITSSLRSWRPGEVYITNDFFPGSSSKMRIDRFSILPELSQIRSGARCEIGVYCHEFGHALGLPDLYDTGALGGTSNKGPGNWCLMSTGGSGTDGASPEYPAHMGAWASLYLGWTTSVRPTQDSLIVLPPIENGGPVIEFWFQGEQNPEHFLIEDRKRLGFDRNLLNEGLIV
jgi:M6 family metalloprotease-like protein